MLAVDAEGNFYPCTRFAQYSLRRDTLLSSYLPAASLPSKALPAASLPSKALPAASLPSGAEAVAAGTSACTSSPASVASLLG